MAYFNEIKTAILLSELADHVKNPHELDDVVHICKVFMNMVKIPVIGNTDQGFDLQIEFHLPSEEEIKKFYNGEIKSVVIGSGHMYPENPTEEEMKQTQPAREHRILCLNDIIRQTNRKLDQNRKFRGQVKDHWSNRYDFNIYYELDEKD